MYSLKGKGDTLLGEAEWKNKQNEAQYYLFLLHVFSLSSIFLVIFATSVLCLGMCNS